MAASANLMTIVRNPGESEVIASFLPPHGRRIAAGGKITIEGDLIALLSKDPGRLRALRLMLDAGRLVIEKTPQTHYYDEVLDETKMIEVSNGVVTVVDPGWGAYSSSIAGQ